MKKRVVSLGLAAMMAMSMTLAVALEMRALLNQQQKTHRAQRELTAKYLKSGGIGPITGCGWRLRRGCKEWY